MSLRKMGKLRAEKIQQHFRDLGYAVNVKYVHDDGVYRLTGRNAEKVKESMDEGETRTNNVAERADGTAQPVDGIKNENGKTEDSAEVV